MGDLDQRQISRDSLFILAELRHDGQSEEHRVKVRNLSAGGMMAEGDVKVMRGEIVWINLRNAGWIGGSVAWVQDNRFGIAFREEIDPKAVRAPLVVPALSETMIVDRRWAAPPPRPGKARKII